MTKLPSEKQWEEYICFNGADAKFKKSFDFENYLCIFSGLVLGYVGYFLVMHKKLQRFPYNLYGWTSIVESSYQLTPIIKIWKC